jgi:type IV pilus assembly protein PilP
MRSRQPSIARSLLVPLLAVTLLAGLTGCGKGLSDLKAELVDKRKRPGGRIEPLPDLKPYESFLYDSNGMRSPFQPSVQSSTAAAGPRPDRGRNREFLEGFSLDTLRMVGTLRQGGKVYGLVQTKDGLVHRVLPGNFIGQSDGKVTAITDSKIMVLEIAPDGLGGYTERQAGLSLAN